MCYNLLDEKWIPVLWKCGRPGRVGIRKALEKPGTRGKKNSVLRKE